MNRPIQRVLIANRGEIALRVIRTCREMGITSIAVFSDPDRTSLHAQMADESYGLSGSKPGETYLDQEKILRIATQVRADAIHPGYGFLSENPVFADRVAKSGIRFIGPSSESVRLLGDKTSARSLARSLGIPTVAGSEDSIADEKQAKETAHSIGFPVLLKAAAGGGGKGMRIVKNSSDFESSFRMAQSEARNAFGDDRVYIEKYIADPHHIEIQVLADHHGNAIALGERECSIQRRHQKVIEESPSPLVDAKLRQAMSDAAVHLVQEARYTNAGTVEFLVDDNMNFYFLEVNARLQVEHPVTEWISGLDLVKEQIRIAEGEELAIKQDQIVLRGHAIECRICAEDPANNFFPSTGTLLRYVLPSGPRVRVDSGARQGDTIHVYYDPLLAKVVCWGESRDQAIQTMRRALSEFNIAGISTTIPFCLFVLQHKAFIEGRYNTGFINQHTNPDILNNFQRVADLPAVIGAHLFHTAVEKSVAHSAPRKNVGGHRWRDRRQENFR